MDETIELYHGLASTASKKVRLCLYEKGLTFKSQLLDLQKFEQLKPEYLAINRDGVVPTLIHRGKTIVESTVIIEYLDDSYPDPPLKPRDAYFRAQMRLWGKFSEEIGYNAVYVPTMQRLAPRVAQHAASLQDIIERVPTKERREQWRKIAQGGFTPEELAAANANMKLCLDRVESAVREFPWLAGADYSLADISMIPFIDRINNLRPDLFSSQAYTGLNDWYKRVRARPAFTKAFDFSDDPRARSLPNF